MLSIYVCLKTTFVPSISSISRQSSRLSDTPPAGLTTWASKQLIIVIKKRKVRIPTPLAILSSMEEQLNEAQRLHAELKQRQTKGATSAYNPLYSSSAAMFLPLTEPKLLNLDN